MKDRFKHFLLSMGYGLSALEISAMRASEKATAWLKENTTYEFVNGHLVDILFVAAAYSCIRSGGFLRGYTKPSLKLAGIVMIGSSVAEFAQKVDFPIPGTYDPMDFTMYAGGVTLAYVVDKLTFRE